MDEFYAIRRDELTMSEKKNADSSNSNKSKLIIIVLIAIIVVFVAAVAAYFLIFSKKNPSTKPAATNATQQTDNVKEGTYSFEDILTNLADTDSPKYVKVTVAVGYDSSNSKLKSELEDTKSDIKTPILRDVVIDVLRTKKASDFTQTGIEQMKKEMEARMNPYLKNGQIDNIYFSNLVIQQ